MTSKQVEIVDLYYELDDLYHELDDYRAFDDPDGSFVIECKIEVVRKRLRALEEKTNA